MFYNVKPAPFTSATLDAIVALSAAGTLDAATAETILGKPAAPVATVTIPRNAGRDKARDAAMAKMDATAGQMRRVNGAYKAQGLRTFNTLASFRRVFPTMLAASLEWDNVR